MWFEFFHLKNDGLDLSREYIDTTDNQHIVTTSQDTVHTNQCTPAGAFIIMQGRQVTRTITKQWHSFLRQVRKYQLARLSGFYRLQCIRINNFREIMILIQVRTMLTFTFVTYTRSGNFTQSVDIICFNTEFFFDFMTHILRPGLRTQGSHFQLEFLPRIAGIFNGIRQIKCIRRSTAKNR